MWAGSGVDRDHHWKENVLKMRFKPYSLLLQVRGSAEVGWTVGVSRPT